MSKFGNRPNPKQIQFFQATARHIAYGGARGGGKSWAMRTKFVMLAMKHKGIQILLLRRTFPELRGNHIIPLQAMLHGVATWNETKLEFTFPNGSRIKLGYCDNDNSVFQYQGQAYDVIGLEEATLFSEFQRDFLTTCNRPSDAAHPVIAPRMYYTCNPGGVGHAWVKRLFIDREYRGSERPEDYVFIPASVYDNPYLLQADPEYIHNLENLPEDMRRMHLNGDWDVLAGQYYSEFRRDIHTCEPFDIPAWWKRYRAIDYGLDCAACVWAAFSEQGDCYIYREYALPDRVISAAAEDILKLTAEPIAVTFGPADMWGRSRESGQTQAELFAKSGLILSEVRQSREDGWLALHEWLKVIDDGTGNRARLTIFRNCTQLIKYLPMLQHDPKKPNDCDTEPHDITHLPDALRYLLAGRPTPAKIKPAPQPKPYNPLDDKPRRYINFNF